MNTPGQLNKRITLMHPPTTRDAAGGLGPYVAGANVWASIDSVSGQNLFQGQFVSESTHKVVIRYMLGVTPSMQVQFGTRTFNILFIGNPKEQNVWLELFCQEVL